jgi:uncharacterized membrane protein
LKQREREVAIMGEEKKVESQGAGYEPMFVMLAYLVVLITAISCVYTLMYSFWSTISIS